MQELRANTQVIVTVGPFPDVGDGFTPQTDITLGGDEAELLKHGSTTVVDISGATWAAVTNCRGYYSLTLTTSHTDTEGMLVVIVQDDSDCLPVKQEYMVLSEAAYDSKYVAKDDGFMDVNLKTMGRTDTQETEVNNLETICAAYTATRGLTGTALPAVAAQAVGGVYTRGSGAGQINQAANGQVDTNVVKIEAADPTDTIRDSVVDDATRIDASKLNILSGHDPGANLGTSTVTTAQVNTEVDNALNTAIPGTPTANSMNERIAAMDNRITDTLALASALTTAQNDLDKLTGSDGVTLATAQGKYAPSKAGDAMKLTSDGLDSVATAEPSGVASNFREMVVQLWRRFFVKATMTSTETKCFKDNDSVATTQTNSEIAGTQTQGTAS